jgi:hypothetical protein
MRSSKNTPSFKKLKEKSTERYSAVALNKGAACSFSCALGGVFEETMRLAPCNSAVCGIKGLRKKYLKGVQCMKKKIGILISIGILFFACNAQALTSLYGGHLTINQNQNDNDGIIAYNDSTINMLGGSVWWININDQVTANIYNGSADDFLAYDSSTFNIYGGSAKNLIAKNTSHINLNGGNVRLVRIEQNSVANVSNGTFEFLSVKEDSRVNLYNGVINYLSATGNSVVYLYAYDVSFTTTGGDYNTGQITGKYLLNNNTFCINFGSAVESYSHIIVVPEPVTLLLLAVGGLVLRRRK